MLEKDRGEHPTHNQAKPDQVQSGQGTPLMCPLEIQVSPALKGEALRRKDDVLTSSSSHPYRSQLVTTLALSLFHSSRNTVAGLGRRKHSDT